jgi:hypothetical protein
MSQTVQQALDSATFYSDSQDYLFVQLPAPAMTAAAGVVAEIGEPFCALLVDKDEISLMLPAEAWTDFEKRLPGAQISDHRYRLITIDVILEPGLVGFIAHVGQALAAANISILPFSAFSRDHLVVPTGQVESALVALKNLQTLA